MLGDRWDVVGTWLIDTMFSVRWWAKVTGDNVQNESHGLKMKNLCVGYSKLG